MQTPEGVEKAALKKYLDELGAFHRWPVPYGYGQPHVDCYACLFGTFWAIEVKKNDKEQPTRLQQRTLREAQNAGAQIAWGSAEKIIETIAAWLHRKAHGGPIQQGRHIGGGAGG
jgi:hypothetical protein